MYRGSASFLLLSALPLLAEKAAIDPYEDLPDYFPQHYRSLADVPEQYHDGEKLTGCFMLDSVTEKFIPYELRLGEEEIECHNPFYWDEHGRIKNFRYVRHGGDPAAKPPSGLPLGSGPREPQPTPCEGCLSEGQVLDVIRIYHSGLGIKPLGYKVSIVRGYPWNGLSEGRCRKYIPNYLDSLHPDPRDPHPNERVNMRRIRRPMMGFNELADICRDPQNRDLTWRITFQIGWHEPENRILNEHNQHRRDWPRTPCTVTHYIHARTGKIQGDQYYWLLSDNPGERCRGATIDNLKNFTASSYQTWKAWYDAYQRVFLYLPDSQVRSQGNRYLDLNRMQPRIERWKREAKERETRRKREAEELEREMHGDHHLPPIDLRGADNPDVLLDSTSDNGTQHIIVYWGESPTFVGAHDDCFQEDDPDTEENESQEHDSKCKKRVPRIRQCDENNIPYSEPPSDDIKTHDCILWARLNGDEQCRYRNPNGELNTGWCALSGNSGFNSAEIHKHIAAVETLTAHQVGMRYNDDDFGTQKGRLDDLFPSISFSENDAFAEINLFSASTWTRVRGRKNLGFYIHRYGNSKYDDPLAKTKRNDQYRRLSAPFDWRTRGFWCDGRRNKTCREGDRNYRRRYTLVHEATHDVTSDHLYDRFLRPNMPYVRDARYQTRGVAEGHALFIEEIAGRRRNSKDLRLETFRNGGDDYRLPTPQKGNRKRPEALANLDNMQGTAEALLVAFRGVEDALRKLAGRGFVSLPINVQHGGARIATRTLFNNSLHSFTYLDDFFGQMNAHVDFCEVRNAVHRRVWRLRQAVNELTPFNVPDPKISKAFDDMDIRSCMLPWYGQSNKECATETGGSSECRLVECALSPGDVVPVMIPDDWLPSGGDIDCSVRVGDAEVSWENGVLRICYKVKWIIADTEFEVEFCVIAPLPT